MITSVGREEDVERVQGKAIGCKKGTKRHSISDGTTRKSVTEVVISMA